MSKEARFDPVTEHTFYKIAQRIAEYDIPASKKAEFESSPETRPFTPDQWITGYAKNLIKDGNCSAQEAITQVNLVFKKRYQMSLQKFADQLTPEQAAKNEAAIDRAIASAAKKIESKSDIEHDRADKEHGFGRER